MDIKILTVFACLAAVPVARAQTPAPAEPTEVKVVPYANVFLSGFYNTGGSNNVDIPLFALTGSRNLSASARGTRLGLRMSGPRVDGARLSGVVETDFYGGFPTIGISDNMGVVRLRLATARLDWAHTSLLVGQDWMVLAPLNPVSIACTGIPLMAASGNPWARLPQLRVEYRPGPMLVQAAVMAPSSGDFNSTFLAQPGSGALGLVPFVQGRVAYSAASWMGTKKPGAIGLSGHYGRSRTTMTAGNHVDNESAAGALDVMLPLTGRLTLAGEAFIGKNLGGFQAAVFQGLNPDAGLASGGTMVALGPRAIGTRGGWAQAAFAAGKVSLYATYGIDDPDDGDLVSVSRRDWRLRNQTVAGSFIHRLSPQLAWSLEVRRATTRLLSSGTLSNTHLNLAASLSF